jgi:hypothetical protein
VIYQTPTRHRLVVPSKGVTGGVRLPPEGASAEGKRIQRAVATRKALTEARAMFFLRAQRKYAICRASF